MSRIFKSPSAREAPAHQAYSANDFAMSGQEQTRAYGPPARSSTSRQQSAIADKTQSEKDWAYAVRRLKAGDDPHEIIGKIARYWSANLYDKTNPTKLIAEAKPKPYYYAEQTVTKAMATLGMAKRAAPANSSTANSRETETAPSR